MIVQTLTDENFHFAHKADQYPSLLKGVYEEGLSEFTLTWQDGNPQHIDLALFGYPSIESAKKARIDVEYTAQNGVTEEYPAKCWFDKMGLSHTTIGDGSIYELDQKLYAVIIISPTNSGSVCPHVKPKHNGRYVFTYYGAGPVARNAVLNIALSE